MELVTGLPIHKHCDRHRLTLERRLALFAAVCEGVRHAHEKAVLHRDLKPSNILVTESPGGPIPKIIDFGLAKALDGRSPRRKLTGEHAVVGTAAYLSPEAIRLDNKVRDLDTRSDIYALGIVLYELLAGVRPFEGIGADLDALRRAFERELPKPSERLRQRGEAEQRELAERRGLTAAGLRQALEGDLDALVLKAMARDRSLRYASAADLAADVQRYLACEPLLV
jgi:non-specific serine/threonine protein kinase/serine/threonine-protein kinase